MSLNAWNKAELKKKITKFFIQTTPFLILIPVLLVSYELIPYLVIDKNLLGIFISASSIIVALIIGFLFNSYFNLKQIRLEKLSRFTELQNKLRPYQEAFFSLAEQLAWKYGHDMFQFPRPLKELQHDYELMKKDEYVPIIWQRSLREAATFSFDTPDFELTHKILTKERLDEMSEQVLQAVALLSRYKHYQYILKVFKLLDTQDLSKVNIADDSRGLEYTVKGILKDGENYRTLEFWETKLSEWYGILQRMQANGRFIYSFASLDIKKLSTYLLFIAGFGILIPIFLMSINNIPSQIEAYFQNLSMVGFVTYFSLSLTRVYKRLTSDRLTLD